LKRNSLDLQVEDFMFRIFHGKGLCDKYVKGLKGIIMSILLGLLLGLHM